MAVVNVKDTKNNIVEELNLPDEIFAVPARKEILHTVVRAHRAAKRLGTVGVKTRSIVRGGGKKPWRQKGTGRARAGSNRSPLWKGGAIIHGPQQRSYDFKVNRKVKRLALKMALSEKLKENSLLVLKSIELKQPKTKEFVAIQRQLEFSKALIVVSKKDSVLCLASRNVPKVKVIQLDQLNVSDIMLYPLLIVTTEVIDQVIRQWM
jgi:large subunit ribosomal protein L4